MLVHSFSDRQTYAVCVVEQLKPYQGVLIIRINGVEIHRENVPLAYDARFGPNYDDLQSWEKIASKVIDAHHLSRIK